VIASSKRSLAEVKHWIGELDAKSGRNIQTYVYVVQNGTASNIAMMLSALYGGEDPPVLLQAQLPALEGLHRRKPKYADRILRRLGIKPGIVPSINDILEYFRRSIFFSKYQFLRGIPGRNDGGGGGAFGTGQRLGPQLNVSRSISSQILRSGEFSGLQKQFASLWMISITR